MSFKSKNIIAIVILITIFISLIVYDRIQSTSIDFEQINVKTNKFTKGSIGIKIVQISDTHLPSSNEFIDNMIEGIAEIKPDLILMTGDLINRDADIDKSGLADMCRRISEIAPVYAVSGNHDIGNGKDRFEQILINNNVKFIDNKAEIFNKNGHKIAIMGLSYNNKYKSDLYKNVVGSSGMETILLAHNPADFDDFFSITNKVIPDLVFSGHAHGGQIRIPVINQGVFAPGQGIFPKYTSGVYTSDTNGVMVVSRGLGSGRSLLLRFNNYVHVPVIYLNNDY